MSRKQASKRIRWRKAVKVLGAAGALSLAGSASAAIVGPAEDITEKATVSRHVITAASTTALAAGASQDDRMKVAVGAPSASPRNRHRRAPACSRRGQ